MPQSLSHSPSRQLSDMLKMESYLADFNCVPELGISSLLACTDKQFFWPLRKFAWVEEPNKQKSLSFGCSLTSLAGADRNFDHFDCLGNDSAIVDLVGQGVFRLSSADSEDVLFRASFPKLSLFPDIHDSSPLWETRPWEFLHAFPLSCWLCDWCTCEVFCSHPLSLRACGLLRMGFFLMGPTLSNLLTLLTASSNSTRSVVTWNPAPSASSSSSESGHKISYKLAFFLVVPDNSLPSLPTYPQM